MSACVLGVFTSCQSTDDDGYGAWEEATPMSEMAVADGEIPPWLLEDDGSVQVSAGERTPDIRNQFAIPDPGATVADSGASGSSSQKQPELAIADQSDDTAIETPAEAPIVTDPLLAQATGTTSAATKPSVTKPTTSGSASVTGKPKPIASTAKPGKTGKKTAAKPSKKPKEPTLVTYKVRPGDNLSEIAKRSNTTVAQIRKDSNIKGSVIYPGQIIKVRYTPAGYKPGKTTAPAVRTKPYTVKRGDTISVIAKRNGVTVAEVLKANNLTLAKASKIRAGQKLDIPVKAAAKPAAKTSSKKKTTRKRTR